LTSDVLFKPHAGQTNCTAVAAISGVMSKENFAPHAH
jgi:hypothetical protein